MNEEFKLNATVKALPELQFEILVFEIETCYDGGGNMPRAGLKFPRTAVCLPLS
jgi:hypothetical protein